MASRRCRCGLGPLLPIFVSTSNHPHEMPVLLIMPESSKIVTAESCFMQQKTEDPITLNKRMEEACEPGVDYGERAIRRIY
ncbi:uncharacterized protein LOC120380271 isoform X2 [Mauremys reevesii]|uniref:uncharacterized protein LOC120379779 isoform X2 n=1 Tax=Mauremys reevesii TaxID=260615 RepID=UPI00193F0F16|nr:uncharacterized protein LOC120379779 isoform X2 [Mauremys reevesii]XP_039353760.1 uncharacterized protein LOC120380271 isoform X2 [Mauremys reevesii]